MKSLIVLLGLVRLVLLTGLLVGAGSSMARVPPGTDDEIRERLQPLGKLCREGEDCSGVPVSPSAEPAEADASLSGEAVYNQFCFACHATGVGGAPTLSDGAAWEARVAKGIDVLYQSTLNGQNVMPPRGTCMSCSDEELMAAVDWMITQQ